MQLASLFLATWALLCVGIAGLAAVWIQRKARQLRGRRSGPIIRWGHRGNH